MGRRIREAQRQMAGEVVREEQGPPGYAQDGGESQEERAQADEHFRGNTPGAACLSFRGRAGALHHWPFGTTFGRPQPDARLAEHGEGWGVPEQWEPA